MILRRGYVHRKFNTPTNIYTYIYHFIKRIYSRVDENIIKKREVQTAYCFEIRTQNNQKSILSYIGI